MTTKKITAKTETLLDLKVTQFLRHLDGVLEDIRMYARSNRFEALIQYRPEQ